MYELKVRNKYGKVLQLTQNPNYNIEEVDGLYPADATINTTQNANMNGSLFNSAYVNNRQIIITLSINYPTERNRLELYKYFINKYPVRLYYKNKSRNVWIDGYVKSDPIQYFAPKERTQIVIECPKPFFNDVEENITEFNAIEALFEFPFAIDEDGICFSHILTVEEKNIINTGDIETGIRVEMRANGPISNPTIHNTGTLDYFKLNLDLETGDVIRINTMQGEKSVTLERNGVTANVVGYRAQGSKWLTAVPGDNLFLITADALGENMLSTLIMVDQYQGA